MPELCSCGSGRTFARCHGNPRNAFAREQALVEARQLAVLFPSVRLTSAAALAFAERVAADLGEEDELTEELLDEGVALVDGDEAERLVRCWAEAYPDRWGSLVHTCADEQAAVRAVVRGALEAAIHERGTTPRELLVELEVAPVSPGPALALLLPPCFVWSIDEARAAVAAVAGRGGPPADLLKPVEDVSYALIRVEHERRVRALAARIERELPFDGFRRVSRRIASACRQASADVPFVRAVAALVLAAYVQRLARDTYITSPN